MVVPPAPIQAHVKVCIYAPFDVFSNVQFSMSYLERDRTLIPPPHSGGSIK